MQLTVEAPINPLSFGNVTYNLLRQFWRRGVDMAYFPIGNVDLSAYDKIENDFKKYLESSLNDASLKIKKEHPVFKMWHINGSQTRVGSKQLLYTFYELNQPTEREKNIVNFQDKVLFSSKYSADQFGCEHVGLGFDEDFGKTGKKYLNDTVVHFGLMGKFEKRKHTEKIIKLWLEKYGNNRNYQLSVCITNPFIKPEEMNQIIGNILEGKRYNNINFLPYLKTNSEVNEFLNSIDIDLTGLSGAEGWNLPAFNATCLGKWSIVLNATSHLDWANKDNCILIEPSGQEECYDGHFFQKGAPFNQGNIYTWDRDLVSHAIDQSVSKKGQNNTEGEKLKEQFSYEKTADRILTELKALS